MYVLSSIMPVTEWAGAARREGRDVLRNQRLETVACVGEPYEVVHSLSAVTGCAVVECSPVNGPDPIQGEAQLVSRAPFGLFMKSTNS